MNKSGLKLKKRILKEHFTRQVEYSLSLTPRREVRWIFQLFACVVDASAFLPCRTAMDENTRED